MTTEYIVLCGRVVGSSVFEVVYSWDGRRFDSSARAVSHGFTLGVSDDFSIGVLEDGALVRRDWMAQTIETAEADLQRFEKIAAQIGLAARAAA